MKSQIFLLSFAVILFSSLCLGYTDEERQADSRRVNEIIRTSLDDDSKIIAIQELLGIYARLAPSLTPEQRESVDKLINETSDEILVDGVPPQGGRKTKFAGRVAKHVAKKVSAGFFEELGSQLAYFFQWFG
ncbi:protein Turandot B2-like [Drosophila rhopaloa]|uniref:Protein Turandot B2-like n=1 Tax=Drosophila rhopaloa TaxID=1041015 RepID=A0A6P4F038_DRORH|nr:protein Turandot B2-like [Drosophila rhopaloa]